MNNIHARVKVANPDMEYYRNINPLDYPFSKHKIASMHEASGRPTLYLSYYTHHIDGMSIEEGQRLLKQLSNHMQQDKYKLVVHWENPGDLAIWDNTCTLHRATKGSYRGKYRRDMRRVSVLDNSSEAFGLNDPNDLWNQQAP